MPWTRATHLNQWADTELASRHLPLLVRKLVRRTGSDITVLNIPANEQTARPGFDGIVECSVGNQFVPPGKSVWEMGTDQKPKTKANRDIAKRTKEISDPAKRAETTFVFVTPRPWHKKERHKKDEWASEMALKGGWKNVVVHDSNDLEHWLDLARDVDAWISRETHQLPTGVQSLELYWKSLSHIAANVLRPDVFTISRESEIQNVEHLLNQEPNSLFIRTPSLSDGIDFLAALAARKSEDFLAGAPAVEPWHLFLLQNALIVFDDHDWRELMQSDGPLLLIASPSLRLSSTDVASAVQAGHYVIVCGPRGIIPEDKGIILRGVQQYDLERALENSGFSQSQAGALSKSCAGNTTILKRRIATHPDTILPAWSKPEVAPDLANLALIGGWVHVDPKPAPQENVPEVLRYVPPIDVSILELVGYTMEELDRLIAQWQQFPEPFFLRFGDSVLVTSREDAWYLLGDYVTGNQLRQFSDLAILVLEENNPALELEPDKRWMASVFGKRHSMSGELRKSLVETLAIMATCPTIGHASPSGTFSVTIERVIETVLPPGCDWKRWASLRSHFQVVAEAAPEVFLSRIEQDLASSSPVIVQLFQEQTGSFFGGRMHCELLWALESMAWSLEYLSRVAVILAKLSSCISLPGNYGNRPDTSLHEIFLLWLPHTTANIDERIAALKQVLKVEPEVGWRLLLGLLPSSHAVSHNTSMPRWRPWADGWSRELVDHQRYEYAMAVADLVFDEIGGEPEKWSDALDGMLRFNDNISQRVFLGLQRTANAFQANPNDAFKLWDKLRATIQSHQDFDDAAWAFSRDKIEELIKVRDRIVPSDVVLKNLWLFDHQAELPGLRRFDRITDHDAELQKLRTEAISTIHDHHGVDGVWRLLELGADAGIVGWVCGVHKLLAEQEVRLPQSLTSADKERSAFAANYVRASYFHRGDLKWIDSLTIADWTYEQRSELAQCLPFDPLVWDWLESQGKEMQATYWASARGFLQSWDESIALRAVAGLLRARRPFTAMHLINLHHEVDMPSDLIAEVLEAGLSQNASEEIGDRAYVIQKLIGRLQADLNFDRPQLARFEFGYLPFLERSYSKTGPDTLVAAVIESPSFYLDLIRAAYRGKNESTGSLEDSEVDRFRARRASELLEQLRKLPGMDEKGNLDSQKLDMWITSVVELGIASGHEGIAAHKIGQFIGRAIYPYLENTHFLSHLAPVIESHGSEDLTDGFINGILNSRGVTTRDPFDGGRLEHDLAAMFGSLAKSIRELSPTLAKCFTTIQSHYERYARREDDDASRLRSGR
jgi:hypothetical protein